jgi:hypothetical protein
VEILLTLKMFEINMLFKWVGTARLDKVVIVVNIPGINKGII